METAIERAVLYHQITIVVLVAIIILASYLAYSIGRNQMTDKYRDLLGAFDLRRLLWIEIREIEERLERARMDADAGKCVHPETCTWVGQIEIPGLKHWVGEYTKIADKKRRCAAELGYKI